MKLGTKVYVKRNQHQYYQEFVVIAVANQHGSLLYGTQNLLPGICPVRSMSNLKGQGIDIMIQRLNVNESELLCWFSTVVECDSLEGQLIKIEGEINGKLI